LVVDNQNCGTISGVTSCGWIVYEYAAPAGVPGFNSRRHASPRFSVFKLFAFALVVAPHVALHRTRHQHSGSACGRQIG